MDGLHVILAFAAGGGLFLSWGYRTALHVALGKEPRVGAPSLPKPPGTQVAMVSPRERAEMTR